MDGITAKHRVITFDNRGVGASSGSTPTTIEEMASDTVTFIRALGFDQVDLIGWPELQALDEPLERRGVLLVDDCHPIGPPGG